MNINSRTNRTMLAIALVAGLFGSAAAYAQTATDDGTGAADTSGNTASSFENLSPGGQKIARSLFEAQEVQDTGTGGGTGDGTTAAADGDGTVSASAFADGQPATLDQIAKAKADGSGWGQVFKEMKAAGLVSEKNLGQVISKANRAERLGGVTDGGGTTDTGTDTGADTGAGTGTETGTATGTDTGTDTGATGEGTATAAATSTAAGPAAAQSVPRGRSHVVITNASGQTVSIVRGRGDLHKATGAAARGGKGAAVTASAGGTAKAGASGNAFGAASHAGKGAGIVSGAGGGVAVGGGASHKATFGNGNAHGGGSAASGIVSGAGGGAAAAGAQAGIGHAAGTANNGRGHAFGNGRK
ncbi:MAG: hypothetical protein COW30_05280 [Rhodospirillales bacterium CG15_BIG_FIL_POST_REV_8_21_14_020_66_15]|nr:MAG: hypothetical protein COW30_05280 [Rhodospirillales bacterium CG15_BIG_FIL_POST_REV_8_21_14_020_66_15]